MVGVASYLMGWQRGIMKDPFSSVENMLQWQIDLVKKRIRDTLGTLNECGEIYPLPKQTDGLPDNWAFGKFTQHQIATAHATKSLDWVSKQIEQAEMELLGGNFPIVIDSIIKINQSINSTNGIWASAQSVRTYRFVKEYRNKQAENSKKSRSKIKEIIKNLAWSKEYENESAKQLWIRFGSELELKEFDPEEIINKIDSGKSSYEYNFLDKRKSITSRRFENVVSEFRKFKSR